MNDKAYKQFADAILSLAPELRMGEGEITASLKAHGLDRFIESAGGAAAELAEAAELMLGMEKREARYGQ